MTVEQKIKTLQSDSSIKVFNHLMGTEYYFGSLSRLKSISNAENYESLKNCEVITTYYRNEVYYFGIK